MKIIRLIAFFKGQTGKTLRSAICAILAVIFFANLGFTQEPELLNGEEAKTVYKELTEDDNLEELCADPVAEEAIKRVAPMPIESEAPLIAELPKKTDSVKDKGRFSWFRKFKQNKPRKVKSGETKALQNENKRKEEKSEAKDELPEDSESLIPYVEEDDEDIFYGEEDAEGNMLTSDTVAVEVGKVASKTYGNAGKIETPPSQVINYARRFWDEAESKFDKHEIDISGTKTFDFKKSTIHGDISQFSTEHYNSYPGSKLNQSLHLEIDGKINKNSTVHAVLDDTEDEDRKFTVDIEGNKWRFVLGDFPISLKGSKFALYSKEVRGIMAEGYFHDKIRSTFIYSQSKGLSRREQFRGAGQQQEYRMQTSPLVKESEKVFIDGVKLVKGRDYQIDYEEGIIKFLPTVLPIEVTRWIVVEYETEDENMAFTRNLFGARHEYARGEGRSIGITWLKELDNKSPKASADVNVASSTLTPMQHDIYEADVNWKLGRGFALTGEYAVSKYDSNRNSNVRDSDKPVTGHAANISLDGKNDRVEATLSYGCVDSDYKSIGREDGVVELGERGLVDDIISSKAKFGYKFDSLWRGFADGEKSKTNIDNDPAKSKIDFTRFNAGFIWEKNSDNRFEVRSGRQIDQETNATVNSDVAKGTSSIVYDRSLGKVKTQTKVERTAYNDDINIASDSEVIELSFLMSSEVDDNISWTAGVSRIALDDEVVLSGLRSETANYQFTLHYEPSRKLTVKGEFQFRREDDFYNNSREDSKLADSQFTYEPNDDFRTTFKYKVENTSKITKDPNLDPTKYILPTSLPSYVLKENDVLNRFENPVEKTTINSTTDYKINKYLSAYVDWRHRDIDDKKTALNISKTDRQTYELRYAPVEKLSFTTEYERGYSINKDSVAEVNDWLKSFQLRNEMLHGYILNATYEETEEEDKYNDNNDEYKKSKILELQRPVNKWVTLELGLQHNDIFSTNPRQEFEKRFALTLTPSSKNQRYKFFATHKDIDAKISGEYYEGGVVFSQFIGTDTIVDGEVKKVYSSKTTAGDGYNGVVANAKVVVTF